MEKIRPTVLRQQARVALKGSWGAGALVTLIYFIIVFGVIFGASFLVGGSFTRPMPIGASGLPANFWTLQLVTMCLTIAIAPLGIGLLFSFWDMLKSAVKPNVESLFKVFCQYGRYIVACLLVAVYTLLWMLLLYVPGIIKSISYSMTYYIMRDNPELSGEQAIKRSMKMMKGHKMEYFLMMLSFIGWIILASITIVGLFWLMPYMYTTNAAFYERLKAEAQIA